MAGTGAAFSLLPPENATGNYVKVVQRIPVKITIDDNSDQTAAAGRNERRSNGGDRQERHGCTEGIESLQMSDERNINKWLITITVMLPAIMEIIDTSVANVALPHMQGSLNAGTDEVTWVLTSYLVANAVVLPMTGWLSRVFGRKRFLMTCIVLFTLASLLCGAAPNLATLIFFRILQGAAGGALIPISQAILMETFPPNQRGMAMAIFGVGAMFGPIVGPALGGWITDNMSWRWIFYINLPIGIIAMIMCAFFIFDPAYLRQKSSRAQDRLLGAFPADCQHGIAAGRAGQGAAGGLVQLIVYHHLQHHYPSSP